MVDLSSRSEIAAFLAMDVLRDAKLRSQRGEDICHMEVGQPGGGAPRLVRERAKEVIDSDLIGYTEALGIAPLRERISRHYMEAYGAAVTPDQIIITTGSSAGFLLSFLATLDVGDRVAIMQPGYPCYREIISVVGLEAEPLSIGPDTFWVPDYSAVERAIIENNVKALLFASPANPTGAMIGNDEMQAIIELTRRHNVWLFSDEIYHGLTYGAPPVTAACTSRANPDKLDKNWAANDHVIVLNSFSKYYSMTGWRIGWMVVPPALTRVMEKLNQHLYISAPTLSQHAAIAAFDAVDELEEIKAHYKRNRECLMTGLSEAGLGQFAPADGAFYIYTDVSHFTDDSLAFSGRLLDEYGIAACPGLDFDPVHGHHMMRFSYAGSCDEVEEAVRRLKARPLT